MLAQLTGDAGAGSVLRSDALDAAYATSAYVHQHFFSQVRSHPWTFAMGNIEENVEALAQGARPTEEVAGKIWELCRLQCNRQELVDAISMFKECRWTTAIAEQLHGFGASIHKLHRHYGEGTLTARTGCAYLRPLIAEAPMQVIEQKAKRKLIILSKRQPEKQGGRQAFIGAFVQAGKQVVAPDRGMQSHESTGLFAEGARQWASLGLAAKRSYADTSKSDVLCKRMRFQDDKAHVLSSLHLAKVRSLEASLADGLVSRISACRLLDHQRQRLQILWETMSDITALRKKALEGVDKPPKCLILDMARVQHVLADHERPALTNWCRRIAMLREVFVGAALAFVRPESTRWFAFMYACQSPIDVVLLPLVVDQPVLPHDPFLRPLVQDEHIPFQFSFAVPRLAFVSAREMTVAATEYIHVLPHLSFGPTGMTLHSNAALVLWTDFLKGMKEPPPPSTKSAQTCDDAASSSSAPGWVHAALHKGQSPHDLLDHERHTVASHDLADHDGPSHFEGDVIHQVMEALAKKRTEAASRVDHFGDMLHFEVCVRGCKDTVHHGVPVDSVRGQACSVDFKDWCKACGFQLSFSCGFKTCGEIAATRLTQEWCRRMEFIYSFWLSHQDVTLDDFAGLCGSRIPRDPAFEEFLTAHATPSIKERAKVLSEIGPSRLPPH